MGEPSTSTHKLEAGLDKFSGKIRKTLRRAEIVIGELGKTWGSAASILNYKFSTTSKYEVGTSIYISTFTTSASRITINN